MLCLGTFLQSVVDCANTGQKEIVGFILSNVYSNFGLAFNDEDDSLISNMVHCIKNPPNYKELRKKFEILGEERYSGIIDIFSDVIPTIHPNHMHDLKQNLLKLVQEDAGIKGDTVVDLVNKVDKAHMSEKDYPLESVMAGVFIYVIKYTNNTMNRNGKKKTAKTQSEKQTATSQPAPLETESNPSDESEDVFLAAQDFCLKYEKEISLLPLCQIAFNINRLHNNVRSMYTDYSRCPQKVKEKILSLNGIPKFTFRKEWIDDAIDNYQLLIKKLGLSDTRYLYAFHQYFPRTYNSHASAEVTNPNPYIFDRPFKNESKKYIIGDYHSPIGSYIGDYIWGKKERPDKKIVPPMDYLWDCCNLGNCDESILTFWICRFIISSSFQIREDGDNIEEFWESVIIEEELLNTQEDMYYYALLQLYLLTLSEEDCKANLFYDGDM